jgi:hypothetical protein
MYFVGASRNRGVLGVASVSMVGILGGLALTLMLKDLGEGSLATRVFFGMALGTVMSHFVIDAGVWKLRYPFQRGYMKEAFAFVFNRPATPYSR